MKLASELRGGSTFKMGKDVFLILKADRRKSTSGRKASRTEMKFKLKNLISGGVKEIVVDASDKMEDIRLDKKTMKYMYESGGEYMFQDQETWDQIELTEEDLGDALKYLIEEMDIDVVFYEGKAVGTELPTFVEREITYTEPGLKGDTTGKATKPAKIETGYELQVPLFCTNGEIIKIDTRTGEYVERINK